LRFRNRTSTFRFTITRSTIALSAPALAVAAIAVGGGLTGSAAAQPVRPAHSVSSAQAAAAASSPNLLTTHAVAAATGRHRLGRNREIAWRMMSHRFGWRTKYKFRSLNKLWDRANSRHVRASKP
jgi:hypothetical protein